MPSPRWRDDFNHFDKDLSSLEQDPASPTGGERGNGCTQGDHQASSRINFEKVNVLDLPAPVQQEHAALLRGEIVFQPYENLNRKMSREDLPELAVSERYSGPNNDRIDYYENNIDQEDPFYEHGEWREVEEEQLPELIVGGRYQGPTFDEGEQVPK